MPDGYENFQDEPANRAPASWRRFSVVLAGKTNGAHESVVQFFKSLGQKETTSPGDAHYCLVFCPVVSRVGSDVSDALGRLPPGKEAVLVVMHHTFNTELVVPPSSSLVDDQRVRLTLDCLFYRGQLLDCGFNDHMKTNIKKFFRGSGDLLVGPPSCPPSGPPSCPPSCPPSAPPGGAPGWCCRCCSWCCSWWCSWCCSSFHGEDSDQLKSNHG